MSTSAHRGPRRGTVPARRPLGTTLAAVLIAAAAAIAPATPATARVSDKRPSPGLEARHAGRRPPVAVGPAVCAIPAALRGQDVTTVSTAKVMALTFDAGSTDTGVRSILATLAARGVPATFFLTGAWAQRYPAAAAAIGARYPVGSHSMTHPRFTRLTDAQVAAELDQAQAAIARATGQDPRPYFRFPEGDVNARVIGLVNQRCYVPFRWTTDTLGWKGTSGGQSVASVTARVLGQARPGGIVLMHLGSNPSDGTTLDAAALPGVISGLQARGYTLVGLDALLPAAP